MFFQFKKINNESGVVLFIVLMTAIIIMIFSVGILTQSVNEINYAQQQIDQIASDEMSKGIFWNQYSSSSTSISSMSTSASDATTGRNYQASMVSLTTSAGITNYSVVVNYNGT